MRHQQYFYGLIGVFLIIVVIAGIAPYDRHDWLLENALTLIALIILGLTHKGFPLSRVSYTLIFLFLTLHEIGSHYTYAQVPYNQWWQALTGKEFNQLFGFERNQYDRLVHFAYGLFLAYPIREMFIRIADVKGFWSYFLPLDLTMSTSMIYELLEWGAASYFGGDLGVAYLGTQGDVWDAQKDMAFASLGALIAMGITLGMNVGLQRDFAREWNESLRVKHTEPLGEDEVVRLLKDY